MKAKKSIADYSDKESKAEFRKCFDKLSQGHDYSTVFGDFLDYALLMMNMNKKAADFKELETRWTKQEDHVIFFEMLNHWSNSSYDFHDSLGDIFMECVSFGRNGQFFTPEPICRMMAQLTIPADIEDGKSIMDCAAGSGRTLLAAATMNRNLKFYAADNDIKCVKMCALNFIINTMVGEVAHMDSLSMQHYKSYHIRKARSGTHYLPYYYITGPGDTDFIEKMEASNEETHKETAGIDELPSIIIGKKKQIYMF
jgi:hypothetical protein